MIIKIAKQFSATLVGVFAEKWAFFTVLFVCSLVAFSFINGRHREKERILREQGVQEQILKDEKEAKAEALRRNAEKPDRSPDSSVGVAPTVRRVPSVLQNRPTREMAEQHPGEALRVLEAAKRKGRRETARIRDPRRGEETPRMGTSKRRTQEKVSGKCGQTNSLCRCSSRLWRC